MTDPLMRTWPAKGGPTLPESLFRNRSGRIIASLRLILAAVFLLALYLEPLQPVRIATGAYLLLSAYVLFSAAMLAIVWRSWWYDFRLAWPAWLVDLLVFAVSLMVTEGRDTDFNSPFLAFFVFLMVAASLRWNWRATGLAALLVLIVYGGVGYALIIFDFEFDRYLFARRSTYMAVIGFVFIAFAMQRGSVRLYTRTTTGGEDALEAALRYAVEESGAKCGFISWEDRDEPPVCAKLEGDVFALVPLDLQIEDSDSASRLFDRSRGRELILGPGAENVAARKTEGPDRLADLLGVQAGLTAPLLSGGEARGRLLLTDIPGMAVDDLERVQALAHEIVSLIESRRLSEMERNRAVMQTREALARDLHDSVAQSLAGASFGLEALRRSLPPGDEHTLAIIDDLKHSFRQEQGSIRELIERLRMGQDDQRNSSMAAELGRVVIESRRRWAIDIALEAEGEFELPAPLAYECKQIVREAIANAVRHGACRRVQIAASKAADRLVLTVANDGKPFPSDHDRAQPWTISQRVEALGGSLQLTSTEQATRLQMCLPIGHSA